MWRYIVFMLTPFAVCSGDSYLLKLSNVTGRTGDNVTFHCTVQKNTTNGLVNITEPVTIEWRFTPIQSGPSRIIYTSTWVSGNKESGISTNQNKYYSPAWGDVTIAVIGQSDAGLYSCHLEEDLTIVTKAQLYVVESGPDCKKDNPGPVYVEGNIVHLLCSMRFYGNNKPTLTWHAPVGKFQLDSPSTSVQVSPEEQLSSVIVKLKHLIDGHMFSCTAQFPGVNFQYTCQTQFLPLSIQYAPYITHLQTYPRSTGTNHMAPQGSNLTLFCTAHGNPTPTWQWSFKPDNSTAFPLNCNKVSCRLNDLKPSNSGQYTCSVMNTVNNTDNHDSQSMAIQIVDGDSGRLVINTDTSQTTVTPVMYKSSGVSGYTIGAIVSASLAVFLIIVFVILALKMRTRERRLHDRLSRMHDENLDDQEVELLDENIQPITSDLPHEYSDVKHQKFEVARKDVRLVDLIAKGTFCEVWRGRMRKYPHRSEIMKVAIKRIVSELTDKERRFFLAELEVLKALQPHSNVLPLLGYYTSHDPWLIMLEFASEGTLYQYLQRRRPGDLHVEINSGLSESVSMKNQNITAHKLLSLASQIVNGIEHLNKFKMILYRLRAASVLVCRGGVCKLSGFGFPQDITDRNLYETNSAPVRWMAPESLLDAVYNVKTDVWAFGILLWEITHFGQLPYPDMGPHEVAEKVQSGYRMPQPSHCSQDLYNLMFMCWNENPDNRPSFGDILQVLTHLGEAASAHIHLENLPDGLKCSDMSDPNSTTVST